MPPGYAELHCLSNFTFLRGASHPEELVERAALLGYTALALTDECSLAGVVRAHAVASERELPLIIGSEFQLADGPRLVLLATDRDSYGNLSALITRARRAAGKGRYHLTQDDVRAGSGGCLLLWAPGVTGNQFAGAPDLSAQARWLAAHFSGRAWIAVELFRQGDDAERLRCLQTLADDTGLPLVAAGNVHMHARGRRALQDTLTAIRLGVPLHAAGLALHANGERHLRKRDELASLYPASMLAETLRIAAVCRFSLGELRYEYPDELVPAEQNPASYLRSLVSQGQRWRWPGGTPAKVQAQIEHELALITELQYEPYFLTVHDIVCFARQRSILCQGRGSAANSAVCYCLGITEVDPARMEMLFERFMSKERDEPPDIDVDFEHERREEVIQYIYRKYGRERAALAATVITYRPRSAVRDVGKALGMSLDQVDRLAKSLMWWDGKQIAPERLREVGLDPHNPCIRQVVVLVHSLMGFPRHLSQHVGGFVISRGLLSRMVPIENAAMPERTIIQWDKNDLDALGLLKVDCLALGMLSAIQRAFKLVSTLRGRPIDMTSIPAEDPAVYEMIQHADTVGVFQIESRAQRSMLPRLRPASFYDLVIEVAIVRPGPIQGDMVHPYLRRRQGLEAVTYPSAAVRGVLERTLGVPIFQEQVIKLAMVAAGFTAGEADQLRRAMAAWHRRGGLEHFEHRLLEGMQARGYAGDFARRVFEQIKGFGEYGFPESHAASFALLVYVSAWLKCHEPAAFTCALLNSQPMGFYAPAQLVRDARHHGVDVAPVDVRYSDWDCTLETRTGTGPGLRLGLRLIKGLSREAAQSLLDVRRHAPFARVEDLCERVALNPRDLEALADGDALAGLAGNRHQSRWAIYGMEAPVPDSLFSTTTNRSVGDPVAPVPMLRPPTEGENIVEDYVSPGLTLGRHPLALLRSRLEAMHLLTAAQVRAHEHGRIVRVAGIVVGRQRPGSASNVVFVTLEDETGDINVIVWPRLAERQRRPLLAARLLEVSGEVQREGEVLHVIAKRLQDHSHLLGNLMIRSRDFH